MTKRARILTCGNCHGFDRLVAQLAELEIDVLGWSSVEELPALALANSDVDVVLYASGPGGSLIDDLGCIRAATDAPVVCVAGEGSSSVLDAALAGDVADVLLLPQPPETILFAIMKASRAPRAAGTGGRAKIITVLSPKGGTGKTVISTNLAAAFASEGARTLLLDLDLQFGDAAIMLGLEPEKTLYDLVVGPGELDPEKLAAFTATHASGLELIPAPLRPEDAELVSEHRLARLLDVARSVYDVIVVDTSPYFHAPMLATLDRTDEILLLCAAFDVPTLKNVRLSLQTLALLSFPSDKIALVLNRFSPKMDIKREEVEAALEAKTRYELPNDRAVPRAVNIGKPVVVAEPTAAFSRAIIQLAHELCPPLGERAAARESEQETQVVVAGPEQLAQEPKSASWLRFLFPSMRRAAQRPLPPLQPSRFDPQHAAIVGPEPIMEAVPAPEPEPEPFAPEPAVFVHAVPEEEFEPQPHPFTPSILDEPHVVVELERQPQPESPAPAPTASATVAAVHPEAEVGVAFRALIDHLQHLGALANELGRAVDHQRLDQDDSIDDVRPAASR
jgi:Flp pilus assembly CpaE family ATPase